MAQHRLGEIDRPGEMRRVPAGLNELEKSPGERGVIVEIRRKPRTAVLVHREQSSLVPAVLVQEVCGARRGFGEFRAPEAPCRRGKARDRKSVPAREYLLVTCRPDTPVSHGQQPSARLVDQPASRGLFCTDFLGYRRHGLEAVQMPLALEIRRPGGAEASRECGIFVWWQQVAQLFEVPGIEAAFGAFRIRIESREETSAGTLHVAAQPVRRLTRPPH